VIVTLLMIIDIMIMIIMLILILLVIIICSLVVIIPANRDVFSRRRVGMALLWIALVLVDASLHSLGVKQTQNTASTPSPTPGRFETDDQDLSNRVTCH